MDKLVLDMSTDLAWEEWGHQDPYYGVITDPKFRRSALNEHSKQEFFASGASHVSHVLATVRKHIDAKFAPRRVLDFGCGVGRLLMPFAMKAQEVVGLDVSPSMLQEARRNCDERSLRNVQLLLSDDALSAVTGTFDLIHSSIVFQHIPVERGRTIFSNLLRLLGEGGVGALHLTYSKSRYAATHGIAPAELRPAESARRARSGRADPEIQMNPYNMNEILFLLQSRGVTQCHAEFSDHGGELGVFLFFSAPGASVTSGTRRARPWSPTSAIVPRKMDILIGGIPRSGTTLLARVVGLHPDIYCWSSETGFLPLIGELLQGLPMRPENGPGVERMITRYLKSALIEQREWNKKGNVRAARRLTLSNVQQFSREATTILRRNLPRRQTLEECASLLGSFLQQYTARRLIAEKTPSNSLLLPGSLGLARRWLMSHREPFAVLASMAARATNPDDIWAEGMRGEIEQRIGLYLRHARGVISAREYPDEVMALAYDRLVTRPRESVERVCAFLQVEPQSEYLNRVCRAIRRRVVADTWRRFAPLDRWKVLHLCASEMQALGYSQSYYKCSFEDMVSEVPTSLKPRIEPLYGVYKAADLENARWMQRSASVAVYAPREINKLALKIHSKISPVVAVLPSPGLAAKDLQVRAWCDAGTGSPIALSALSLEKDFYGDWIIDLDAAQPRGHHGDWRLFKIDFTTGFAYTPCFTLIDVPDERTFSLQLVDWHLQG